MAVTIRPLLKEDQEHLKTIFGTLIEQFDEKAIGDIMRSGESQGNKKITDREKGVKISFVFFEVLKKAVTHMSKEVDDFLAGLIDKTPEEYKKMPFDIDIQILTQLKEAPEVESFFTGASQLFSGTAWSSRMLAKLKAKLDSIKGYLDKD